MDDPYGSSRGTHNYPSPPNAARSHNHSAANLCPAPPACNPAVVDKSSGTRCMYRLELWFRKKDEAVAKELLGTRRAPVTACAA